MRKHKPSWLQSGSTQHTSMQMANFCKTDAPFQALTNPASCIAALYVKNGQEVGVQCSPSVFHTPPTFPPVIIMSTLWICILTPAMQGSSCNNDEPWQSDEFITIQAAISYPEVTTSLKCYIKHFHLPLHLEDHTVAIHVSLDKANLNTINISTPDFHIWYHFDSNWNTAHMQKLVNIPEVPIAQLYKHMIGQSEPILPFVINRDMEVGPSLTCKLLRHRDLHRDYWDDIHCICRNLLL